jgi:hypothetical protein
VVFLSPSEIILSLDEGSHVSSLSALMSENDFACTSRGSGGFASSAADGDGSKSSREGGLFFLSLLIMEPELIVRSHARNSSLTSRSDWY